MNYSSFFKYSRYAVAAALVLTLGACGNDDDGDDDPAPDNSYTVPETYNFENVKYTGQTERLDMLAEMTTYMKTGNTQGTTLDAQILKDMFANVNGQFSTTYSKNLESKTFAPVVAMFQVVMDVFATAWLSATPGSDGTAGVVTSIDGAKSYLLNEDGVEYTQLIEKGLMGATFYYQATAVYLSDDRIGDAVDNTTVVPGEGTDMEHHWDEAFGYFGVEKDFPTNTDVRFWGNYCNGRDGVLGTNSRLMDALLKGRAAISNNDKDAKLEARTEVSKVWEEVVAGTAIHYINGGLEDFNDDALRCHQLSEAWAFILSLKYNSNGTLSASQVDALLAQLGADFYDITVADLNALKDSMAATFGLESVKDQL
ncbi:MAG: DUF4856 domain-containing protein [Salibacteraceae bacterium]